MGKYGNIWENRYIPMLAIYIFPYQPLSHERGTPKSFENPRSRPRCGSLGLALLGSSLDSGDVRDVIRKKKKKKTWGPWGYRADEFIYSLCNYNDSVHIIIVFL